MRAEPPHSQLTKESPEEKEEAQLRTFGHSIRLKRRNSEGISIRAGTRASLANAIETRVEMLEENEDLIDRQLELQAEIITSRDRQRAGFTRIHAVDSATALA
jgi:hypothetical protein